jgi:hypothetical protein
VVEVVGDLLDRLAGHGGQGRVGRVEQAPVDHQLVCREAELAGHGRGEVAIGLFDQQAVDPVPLVPQVGEVVLAAAGAVDRARVGEQGASLAQQVEGDVGQGDVLFDGGRLGRPLTQPVRADQRIVAEAEGDRGDVSAEDAHRCSTPSGRS